MVDVSETITPNSEQVNAEDLIGGERTVTVTKVEKGTADQPVFIHTSEFAGRTYRPAKSMRRVLIAAWGADAASWVGRSITLYNDPTVKWAGQEVGGVRIAALSHIAKPMTVNLTVSRGKRAPFTVQPLDVGPDPKAVEAALTDIAGAESLPALKAAFDLAGTRGVRNVPEVVAAKDKRKNELS